MTGEEYLDSLRDAREVYIYGERVKDVTDASRRSATAPARSRGSTTRCTIRPADGVLTAADRHRQRRLHPPVLHDRAHSRGPRRRPGCHRGLAAAWSTAGWAVRPDYKASFLGTLGANAEFYGDVRGQRAALVSRRRRRRCCTSTTRSCTRRSTATARPTRSADVCVHVEKETDAGLIVSRRQSRRDRLGADPLQLHRALRASVARKGVRAGLHRADGRRRG